MLVSDQLQSGCPRIHPPKLDEEIQKNDGSLGLKCIEPGFKYGVSDLGAHLFVKFQG